MLNIETHQQVDKDPSEMGFENFTKLIQNTTPLTYYDLMEQKLAI